MVGLQLTFFQDEVELAEACTKNKTKFGVLAQKLQAQVDKKWLSANAKCNTQRKARFADSAMKDWQKLRLLQGWYEGLASAWDNGTLPGCLQFLGKEQIALLHLIKLRQLTGKIDLNLFFTALNYASERDVLRKGRIATVEGLERVLAALDSLFILPVDDEATLHIKKLERDLIGCSISGYVPTPPALCKMVVDAAELKPGMRVLEPSAGKGDLASEIMKHAVTLDVIEQQWSLRKILELKGFNLVAQDFLEFASQYERVLLNPPFEDGAYITHIRHAFACLAPGGRLVAIAPRGFDSKRGKMYESFTDWLGGQSRITNLPDDGFKDSDVPCGIRTCMIVINKY
jgi:hypothetical protein